MSDKEEAWEHVKIVFKGKKKQLNSEGMMRRKRIKIEGASKVLNKFYKVFTNAKVKCRGSQLVVILPDTIKFRSN